MQRSTLDPLPAGSAAPDVLAVNASARALARAQDLGFSLQSTVTLPGLDMAVQRLQPPRGLDAVQARDLLAREAGVDGGVSLNRLYRPYRIATSDDANIPGPRPAGAHGCNPERCFGDKAIGWHAALKTCSRHVRIGVIDTMVDHSHPALRPGFQSRRISARAFGGDDRRVVPSPHGTGILTLLAGAPDSGTPGMLPESSFLAADIFHADANGQPLADTVSLLRALDWMEHENVRIINLSVAGAHDPLMERAIDKLARKGILFVAAAGNEGPSAPPVYPAAYKTVIAVTAVGRDLRSYRLANRGDYIDAATPGVNIWTAVPGGMESYQSGTSFAVPYATAVIASLYDGLRQKTKDAALTAIEYRDLGLPGRDPVYGRGLMIAPKQCGGAGTPVAGTMPAPTLTSAPSAAPPAPAAAVAPSSLGTPALSLGFAGGKP